MSDGDRLRHVYELVAKWTAESGQSQDFFAIRELLEFLKDELYEQYQPIAEKLPFLDRLARWLQNVDGDNERKCLFNFVPWLLFVGRDELESMFRAAVTGPIARWIIDEADLDITSSTFEDEFNETVRQTFFGSLVGMDIGSFLRINSLTGQSYRPAFRDEARIGDVKKFKRETVSYKRFVAVEDMVGTGTQMLEAAPFLAQLSPKSVLICPLIIAPDGVNTWKIKLEPHRKYAHIKFDPLFVIPTNATLPRDFPDSHPSQLREIHRLANDTCANVLGGPTGSTEGAFGFGDFGSLVLTYLNCPDNVPPLIHHASEHWCPLFPRNSRES